MEGSGESRLHIQQAHLSPHRIRGQRIAILTWSNPAIGPIESGVRVDIPLLVFEIRATVRPAVPALLDSTARVPAQSTLDAGEPLAAIGDDRGERVLACFDGDVVALAELDAALTVEGTVGSRARCVGDGDPEEM